MPAFLTEDTLAEWLSPGKLAAEQKDPLLAQLENVSTTIAGQLVTVPVDRKVNNVRTLDRTDPTLIAARVLCRYFVGAGSRVRAS